ncbi:MAG: ABC transporter substrate-binding protein [Chromatiaceae bacterium]|jgi:phospholipid transport system substrate-binding protein
MKSARWLLVGAVLAMGGAQAVPQYESTPVPDVRGPLAVVPPKNPALALRAGVDRLLAFLNAETRPSAEALAVFLNSEIAPYFDFDYMAKSAGGRLYENLDEPRRQAMAEDIKRTFLTKMAQKLEGYDDQQVRFLPPRAGNDGRTALVSVAILNPGTYPARLDFRLYRQSEQWRVYDVAANGQSAIVHYRRQLMRDMQQRQMRRMRPMAPPMPVYQRGMPPPGYGPSPLR